jgi:hypothetical protein
MLVSNAQAILAARLADDVALTSLMSHPFISFTHLLRIRVMPASFGLAASGNARSSGHYLQTHVGGIADDLTDARWAESVARNPTVGFSRV